MRRSLTLILVLALLGSLPLAASAAQPKLSSADKAAIGQIFKNTSALTLKLLPKAKKALSGVTGEYTKGCQAKYEGGTQANTKVIAETLLLMNYLRFVKLGYPVWASYSSQVERVKVSHPMLQKARSAFPIERSEGAKVMKVDFGVCDAMAQIASAGFTENAAVAWANQLMISAGFDQQRGNKADATVKASRPALLAAGLTGTQAKLVLDAETGDIFAVMTGLR